MSIQYGTTAEEELILALKYTACVLYPLANTTVKTNWQMSLESFI